MKRLTTLLILLLPCLAWAGDCKVHRASVEQAQWCYCECNESGCGPCLQPSHWVDTCAYHHITKQDLHMHKGRLSYYIDIDQFTKAIYSLGDDGKTWGVVDTLHLPRPDSIAGMGLTASASETDKIAAQIDSLASNIAWLRKNMPTKKDFAALRRWSLDQEYQTCIDTLQSEDAISALWDGGTIDGYFLIRKQIMDSCKCAVYGKGK